MKLLQKYARFVRENHLHDFVENFLHYSKQLHVKFVVKEKGSEKFTVYLTGIFEEFLTAIEQNQAVERIIKRLQALEKNEMPLFSKEMVEKDDFLFSLHAQQQAFLSFIPNFTPSSKEAAEIFGQANQYYIKAMELAAATSFKIKQQKLIHSEQRLNTVISSAKDAIVIADKDTRVIEWNAAAEEMFGYSREEAIGTLIKKLIIPPEYRDAHDKGVQRFHQTGEGPVINSTVELRGLHKDGHELPVELSLTFWEEDNKRFFVGILRDISERRKREIENLLLYTTTKEINEAKDINAALFSVIKNICKSTDWSYGGFLIPNKKKNKLVFGNNFYYINEELKPFAEASKKTDYEPNEGLPGRCWANNKAEWMKDVSDISENYFKRYKIAQEVGLKAGLCVPISDEEEVIAVLEFYKTSISEADERLVRLVSAVASQLGTAIMRKKAENELKKLNLNLEKKVEERTEELSEINKLLKKEIVRREEIEKEQQKTLERLSFANQELRDFTYIISHDLKAPLRGIGSLVDFLLIDYEDKLDEQGKQHLYLLKDRVEKMNNLLQGILQYSRIEGTKPEIGEVDAHEVAEEVISGLDIKNIKINIDNQLPKIIFVRAQLTQVFQNLISNSIKYMGREEGNINIGSEEKDNEWLFYVKDNGPGIAEKYHEKIFQLFQSLEKSTNIDSTGIGLTLVKKIITGQGGHIWLESKTGEGATFYFTIPKNLLNAFGKGSR